MKYLHVTFRLNAAGMLLFCVFTTGILLSSCRKTESAVVTPAEPAPSPVNFDPDSLNQARPAKLQPNVRVLIVTDSGNAMLQLIGPSKLRVGSLTALQNGRQPKNLRVDADSVLAGMFLFAGKSEVLPNGLFGKIKAVQKSGDGVLLDFVDAKLEEVFDELSLDWSWSREKKDTITKSYSKDFEVTPQAKLQLSGDFKFIYHYKLVLNIAKSVLTQCSIYSELAADVSAKASLIYPHAEFEKSWELYHLPQMVKDVKIKVGPVTIPLSVTLDDIVNLDVSLNGRMDLKGEVLHASYLGKVGMEYNDGLDVNFIADGSQRYQWLKKETFGSSLYGTFRVTVSNNLSVGFYNQKATLSGGLGIFGQLEGVCDTRTGLKITAKAGLNGQIGGSVNILKFFPFKKKVSKDLVSGTIFEKSIAASSDECEIPKDSPTVKLTVHGDPHFLTADRTYFNMQAIRELLILKSAYNGLTIQARQALIPGLLPNVSVNTAFAVSELGDTISFQVAPQQFFLNRKLIPMEGVQKLAGSGFVQFQPYSFVADFASGDRIEVHYFDRGYLNYIIALTPKHKKMLTGVLGNWDGDEFNDLSTRDGIIVNPNDNTAMHAFADSWEITDAGSLFQYAVGKNTSSYTDRDYPKAQSNFSVAELMLADNFCRGNSIQTEPALTACRFDYLNSGKSKDFIAGAEMMQDNVQFLKPILDLSFHGDFIDRSGYNNQPVAYGDISFTADHNNRPNQAIYFNKAGLQGKGYLSIAKSPTIATIGNQFTVAVWVFFEKFENGFGNIICRNPGSVVGLQVQTINNYITSDGNRASVKTNLPLNQWLHIAVVGDGSLRKFYLGGELIGQSSASPLVMSDGPIEISRDPWGSVEYNVERMSDFKLYNRALSDEEIKALYNQ